MLSYSSKSCYQTLIAALRGIGENAVADGINVERQTVPMSRSEIFDRPMFNLATPPTIHIGEGHLMHPTIGNPGVHNLEHKIDEVSVLRDIANELQDKYDFLVLAVKNSLKRNCIDIEDAKTLIKERLKRKARVVSELMPCMDILDKANDFESFFHFLSKYDFFGYINYRLLKNLSLLADDDRVNERFAEYETEYAKLLSATSFKSLIPLFEKQSDLSPTAPLGLPYVSFCLEKPDSFTSAHDWVSTFDEFSWSQDAFLKQLQKKCIIVTYAILPCVLDDVIRDLKDPLILKKLKDKEITVIKLLEIEEDPQIETARKEPISRQLRKFKEDPSRNVLVDVFHGLMILHEKGSQDIVEGDGGCFSRAKGIVHQLSDGSTIRETKKNIVIKSIPNGDNPGMMEIQTESGKGSAIEFYSGDKILEATDHEVIVTVPYGLDDDSEFHLLQTSMENGQYLMVNESRRCVCLKVKDDGNELVSLNVDEAEREKSCIQRYITVYQDDSSSSPSNTALFFTYKKSDQKMYNCYLVPNDSSDKIALPEIEVDGKSYDELRVLHEKYLKFNTGPEILRSTSDEESGVLNTEPDTSSLSDHSVQ